MNVLEKVTCFVMNAKQQLALFQHPYAGVQIPAGTIELNEPPLEAALREAWEETGFRNFYDVHLLGTEDTVLPASQYATYQQAPVYARPDLESFNWATLRRGIYVEKERECDDFAHITYREYDQDVDPTYITYQITGWVQRKTITNVLRRYFYVLHVDAEADAAWSVMTDNHTFTVWWANPAEWQDVHSHQIHWLKYLDEGVWKGEGGG